MTDALCHLHILCNLPNFIGVCEVVKCGLSSMNQSTFLSAVIERVMLRGVTHKSEDTNEYVFEVSTV